MSKWIRKGDKVCVIAGNDKGKVGTVLSRGKTRILVEGVNIRKKHMKARSEEERGGIIPMEMPIHISNVQLVGENDQPVKLRVRFDEKTQEKVLFYRKASEERPGETVEVIYRPVKKYAR
ncbi:MAG: 50S ribosomal protein L24 [Chlamydiota bacterium]